MYSKNIWLLAVILLGVLLLLLMACGGIEDVIPGILRGMS